MLLKLQQNIFFMALKQAKELLGNQNTVGASNEVRPRKIKQTNKHKKRIISCVRKHDQTTYLHFSDKSS